jgi:hypothetical protein
MYINPVQSQPSKVTTSTQAVEENLPNECVQAGITTSGNCELYLDQMRVVKECIGKGIIDQASCRNYLFENYGRPLRCQGMGDTQCDFIINNIILADLKNIIPPEAKQQLSDSANATATINSQTNTITVQGPEPKEIKVDNLPIVESSSVKLVSTTNNENQETLSPVVIVFDADGDGLPDDLERRIGTDPNKKDTDGDGVNDAEELKKGTDPLSTGDTNKIELAQVDKAIVNGESFEQPKYNESETREDLTFDSANNIVVDENGKNNIRFQGTARPNEVITLYIYSTMPIVVTVKADASGNWIYDLDKTLVDGKHEVYVAVNDDKGRVVQSGLPKLLFIQEAKAVGMDGFIDASTVPDKSDNMMMYYLIGGLVCILIIILIFLIIKSRMTRKTYEQ